MGTILLLLVVILIVNPKLFGKIILWILGIIAFIYISMITSQYTENMKPLIIFFITFMPVVGLGVGCLLNAPKE